MFMYHFNQLLPLIDIFAQQLIPKFDDSRFCITCSRMDQTHFVDVCTQKVILICPAPSSSSICTGANQTPKPPWCANKEAYLAHLSEASSSSLLVSLADKIHNASSILRDLRNEEDSVWSRFAGVRDGTLWYSRALVEAFRVRGQFTTMADELDRAVRELERLAT